MKRSKREITSGDLSKMTSSELERQANILLYGHSDLTSPGTDGEIIELFRRKIYTPSLSSVAYECPLTSYQTFQISYCDDCKRPRSYFSGRFCRECYRMKARERFETESLRVNARLEEQKEGAAWLESQRGGAFTDDGLKCAITMPETEWWSDTDYIPFHKNVPKGNNTKMDWDK